MTRDELINRYLAAVTRKNLALDKLKRVRRKSSVQFWVRQWQKEKRRMENYILKLDRKG